MIKRGQVTIFVIIAIIIVGAIALFLIFGTDIGERIGIAPETNPESFLDSCLKDKVKEGIEIISMRGGSLNNPLNKSYLFKDKKSPIDISYLCYNQNDYLPCVNQEPMLFQHLENEIKDYISDNVTTCFNDLEASLKRQGYSVQKELRSFEVKLQPKRVVIETDSEITLTKAGETSKQEDFRIFVGSRLYEIAEVVLEIVNKEATACEFSHYDMFLYPKFDINTIGPTADSSIIYLVRHEDSNEEFRFAVRGCVVPPGY